MSYAERLLVPQPDRCSEAACRSRAVCALEVARSIGLMGGGVVACVRDREGRYTLRWFDEAGAHRYDLCARPLNGGGFVCLYASPAGQLLRVVALTLEELVDGVVRAGKCDV